MANLSTKKSQKTINETKHLKKNKCLTTIMGKMKMMKGKKVFLEVLYPRNSM
jgi:hypothetical protein